MRCLRRVLRNLVYILFVVLCAPFELLWLLAILGSAALLTGIDMFWSDVRLLRQMKHQHRTISPEELMDRSLPAAGILLEEAWTLGWNQSRLWWTPEDVPSLSPFPPPGESGEDLEAASQELWRTLAFTRWAYARYLDPQEGSARLVRVRNGHRWGLRLVQRNPALKPLWVWSGGIEYMEMEYEAAQASSDSEENSPYHEGAQDLPA